MLAADLQSWLVPIFVPVATVGAAYLAARPIFREVKIKQEAEARLAQASRAEVDARLLGLFVELIAKAHARGQSAVAESVAEAVIASGSPLAPTTLTALNDLVESVVVTYPVGAAEQQAAIAALAELGTLHDVLRAPALAGLESLEEIPGLRSSKALKRGLRDLRRPRLPPPPERAS